MKKTLLLAGAACLFPVLANAQMMSGNEAKSYIGVDYIYDKADFKKDAKSLDDGYNSASVNAGVRVEDFGIEAFYQHSGERKTHLLQQKAENTNSNSRRMVWTCLDMLR